MCIWLSDNYKIKRFQESGLSAKTSCPCVPLRSGQEPQIRAFIKLSWISFFGVLSNWALGAPPDHLSASSASDKIFRALQISQLGFQ